MHEEPTAYRIPDPGVRALFAEAARYQAWLDVEAALAQAQAELGIIPPSAAEEIAAQGAARVAGPARASTRASRAPATRSCRWSGSWTASVTATARRLGALGRDDPEHHPDRRSPAAAPGARDLPAADRRRSCAAMADLAERTTDMLLAGRTHGQHAVPATFGFKVAVWIDELLRHVERLQQASAAPVRRHAGRRRGHASPRSARRPGGPGQDGRAPRHGLDDRAVARTIGDHLAENICLLGLLAATCSKIGREIYTLMKTGVRRGRGAGAAGHGRQQHHAAEAQSQALARTSSPPPPRCAPWCRWRSRPCRPSTRPIAPPA